MKARPHAERNRTRGDGFLREMRRLPSGSPRDDVAQGRRAKMLGTESFSELGKNSLLGAEGERRQARDLLQRMDADWLNVVMEGGPDDADAGRYTDDQEWRESLSALAVHLRLHVPRVRGSGNAGIVATEEGVILNDQTRKKY